MKVNHINYPDDNNQIFCKSKNAVVTLDKQGRLWKSCIKCPYFNGTYQGHGVECFYDDKPPENSMIRYYDNAKAALLEQSKH